MPAGRPRSQVTEEPKPTGRPAIPFSQEQADILCLEIATSNKSLRTIVKDKGLVGIDTVYRWLRENEGFAEQYARAKEDQADFLFEEILEIADESNMDYTVEQTDNGPKVTFSGENVQRSKLKVEARKWAASKLKPKRYGDKLDLNHSGELVSKVIQVELPKKG